MVRLLHKPVKLWASQMIVVSSQPPARKCISSTLQIVSATQTPKKSQPPNSHPETSHPQTHAPDRSFLTPAHQETHFSQSSQPVSSRTSFSVVHSGSMMMKRAGNSRQIAQAVNFAASGMSESERYRQHSNMTVLISTPHV
jgi:hypothetical protein